jgi:2'-5' RNA ligase
MRCFVALDLPREVMNHIKEIQENIRKQNLFTGKFTEVENLHLTLKFLGEINEEKTEQVKEKLKEIRFDEFEAELGEVGVFSKKFLKIIWVKLKGADKLQKQVDEALKEMFQPEFRFMGHITIARVKKAEDRNRLIQYLKQIKPKKLTFNVNKFFLKKSNLHSEGPVYEDIEEYNSEEKK